MKSEKFKVALSENCVSSDALRMINSLNFGSKGNRAVLPFVIKFFEVIIGEL